MLSSVDSLEASFQRIDLTIGRMCGLFGRPEGSEPETLSSPPLAEDLAEVRPLLLPPEEYRLASLARRAKAHAERLERCCQDLQEKYEQVAAVEQKFERSSVIWKVALHRLTELLVSQRAQLSELKARSRVNLRTSSVPSMDSALNSLSPSPQTTVKRSTQKGPRRLKRRDSEDVLMVARHGRGRSDGEGIGEDVIESETDDSNLRNALEIMWEVERAKKARESPQPQPQPQQQQHHQLNSSSLPGLIQIDTVGENDGMIEMGTSDGNGNDGEISVGLDGKVSPDTELRVCTDSNGGGGGGGGGGDDDDIEQVSASILGNIVVLDEILREVSACECRERAMLRKKCSSLKVLPGSCDGNCEGGDDDDDDDDEQQHRKVVGSGEKKKKGPVMIGVAVQTDPLAPEQLRSLVDNMVISPRQDQGCTLQ